MDRLPGWEPQSYGYHGDDGNAFRSDGKGRRYGPTFGTGARILLLGPGGCIAHSDSCVPFMQQAVRSSRQSCGQEHTGRLRTWPTDHACADSTRAGGWHPLRIGCISRACMRPDACR